MMPRADTSWMDEAACKDIDTEVFFPGKGQKAITALRVCHSCPVRAECLDYAFTNESAGGYHHYGIYGGLGPAERKRVAMMRRQGRIKSVNDVLPTARAVPTQRTA